MIRVSELAHRAADERQAGETCTRPYMRTAHTAREVATPGQAYDRLALPHFVGWKEGLPYTCPISYG